MAAQIKIVPMTLPDGTMGQYTQTLTNTEKGVTGTIYNVRDAEGNTYSNVSDMVAAHKSAAQKEAIKDKQTAQTTGGAYQVQEKALKDGSALTNAATVQKSDATKKEESQASPKSVVDESANNKTSTEEKAEEESPEKKTEDKAVTNRPTDGTDTNVFYVDVKVFLEGVQVPHSSAAVSYGIGTPPTCSVTLPAAGLLRGLPETTKILIVYRDLLPDPKTHKYEWRVLFDGELSGMSYSVSSSGAQISLSGTHTSAYLMYMQLLNQAATEYVYNRAPTLIGDLVSVTVQGNTKQDLTIIKDIISSNNFESGADITYSILRHLLEGFKNVSPVSQWYWEKLGNDKGGYKLLNRIYGVSEATKSASLIPMQIEGGVIKSSKDSTDKVTKTPIGRDSTYNGKPKTNDLGGSSSIANPNQIAIDAVSAAEWVSGKTGIPADLIYAQWSFECKMFSSLQARTMYNLAGLKVLHDTGPSNKAGKDMWWGVYNSVDEFAQSYYNGYLWYYQTGKKCTRAWDLASINDPYKFAEVLITEGYCAGTTIAEYGAGIKAHMGEYTSVKNQIDPYDVPL